MTAHAPGGGGIASRIKSSWREFERSRPGHRFRDRYGRRRREGHTLAAKLLYLVAGFALFVVGLILMLAPGPGFLVIFLGAGLVAKESYTAATALDWTEVRVRRIADYSLKKWRRASLAQKGLVLACAALAAIGSAFATFAIVFD
jgi:uncharacterized protein (TIGR02611 family)